MCFYSFDFFIVLYQNVSDLQKRVDNSYRKTFLLLYSLCCALCVPLRRIDESVFSNEYESRLLFPARTYCFVLGSIKSARTVWITEFQKELNFSDKSVGFHAHFSLQVCRINSSILISRKGSGFNLYSNILTACNSSESFEMLCIRISWMEYWTCRTFIPFEYIKSNLSKDVAHHLRSILTLSQYFEWLQNQNYGILEPNYILQHSILKFCFAD